MSEQSLLLGEAFAGGGMLQSAMYLLKVGDRLSSTVTNFTDYALVHKWSFGLDHYIQGTMTGQIHPRRPTHATPLEVYVHYGDYLSKLLTMAAKQEVIAGDDTKLVVLTSAVDVSQIIFQFNLTSAVVESVQLSTDHLPFFKILLRYKAIELLCNSYDQESLTKQGTVPFKYDLTTHDVVTG